MADNGAVEIQGCAYRIGRLASDGSVVASSTGMIQDDRGLVKLEMKPVMEAGVEITPKSACGVPVISYKDCDRYKRWEITLTLGDWDPEAQELIAGGQILTAPGSTGRTFNDGQTTINENVLTSPALGIFLTSDVGRSISGSGVPANTYVQEYISSTQVRMNNVATATATGVSITLGAISTTTIGYQFPHLLLVNCPYGVSIEVWSKLIVRGTGYQGQVPYPSAGTPTIPGSGYLRTGVFRAFLWHDAMSIENKETTPMFTGWAIENPGFGTGPVDDWRVSALPGIGAPVDTSAWSNQLCDFELPAPLQPGYQVTPF